MSEYEKIYLNDAVYIKKVNFTNGGHVLDVGINIEKLMEHYDGDKDILNFTIAELKEPRESYGKLKTHYAYLTRKIDTGKTEDLKPNIELDGYASSSDGLPF